MVMPEQRYSLYAKPFARLHTSLLIALAIPQIKALHVYDFDNTC